MNAMTTEKPALNESAERADRRTMFLGYGFTPAQAEHLCDAREGLWPLHHLKVKRALDAGATHDEAFAIFA